MTADVSETAHMIRTIDFITKHFLVVSAGLSGLGATVAIIFISGYLTVFDKTLI